MKKISYSIASIVALIVVNTVCAYAQIGLYGLGDNQYGQLGDGTTNNRATIAVTGVQTDWAQIATGANHTIALKSNGTLWAWGKNTSGQLGDGTTQQRNSPVQIGTATNWVKISCGEEFSFAIKSDGSLWGWGDNGYRQLGDGTTVDKLVPTQIGAGSVWIEVSCGTSFAMGIKSDNTLWGWGNNTYGQLGDNSGLQRTTPTQAGFSTTWAKVACGTDHALAIKTNGTLWTWGRNGFGQLGNGNVTNVWTPTQIMSGTTWTTVSGGYNSSFAIKSDSTLWAWGMNNLGQLGDGTTNDKNFPAQIGTSTNWAQVNSTQFQTVARKSDNSLWAWGSVNSANSPVQIATISNCIKADCGAMHIIALKSEIIDPTIPHLIAPSDEATNQYFPIQLKWSKVYNNSLYVVKISQNADFSGTVYTSDPIVSDTTFNFDFGISNTTYYWKVQSINNNVASAFQNPRKFTSRNYASAVPTLVSPINQADGLKHPITLKWNNAENAYYYYLQVSTAPDLSGLLFWSDPIEDTTYLYYPQPINNQTLYWRVCSKRYSANSYQSPELSDWSDWRSFTTYDYFASVPQLISPVSQTTSVLPIEFKWHKANNTMLYWLQMSTTPDFSGGESINEPTIEDTVASINNLGSNKTWYWRVKSVSQYSSTMDFVPDYSEWSDIRSITTFDYGTETPLVLTPANTAANLPTSVYFKWRKAKNADHYVIYITENADLTNGTNYYIYTDTTFAKDLLANKTYFWKIKSHSRYNGIHNSQAYSDYTPVMTFTTRPATLPTPVLNLPANNASGVITNPTFTWSAVPGATGYNFRLSKEIGFQADVISFTVDANTLTFATPLSNITNYYWKVQAINADNESPWTPQRKFTTRNPNLAIPQALYPLDSAVNLSNSVRFVWTSVPNAVNYQIMIGQRSEPGSSSFMFYRGDIISDTTILIDDLDPNSEYSWEVQAYNAVEQGSGFCQVEKFSVGTFSNNLLAQPIYPAQSDTAVPVNPIFKWHSVIGVNSYRFTLRKVGTFLPLIETLVADTSFGWNMNLENSTAYTWTLTPMNGNLYGETSSRSFTTAAAGNTIYPVPNNWTTGPTNTGNFANVGFVQNGSFTIGNRPIQNGDAIGVFYSDGNSSVCAGYLVWDGVQFGISVWGNNSQTPAKDGFNANEAYTFKVWDAAVGEEYPVEFTVSQGNGYYTENGLTLLSIVRAIVHVQQNIPCQQGWNMVSGYVIPELTSITTLTSNIINNLSIMKNATGQTYWPGYMTTLSTWNIQNAYAVNVTSACNLSLVGEQIVPEQTPIMFANAGWYWIPYLRTSNQAIGSAINSIGGNYAIVKSMNGQTHWPGYMTTLTDFEPNKGYMVYITTPTSLTYSANNANGNGKIDAENIQQEPIHLVPDYSNTGNSATLAIEIDGANSGDEFGVYSADGLLVGSAVYSGKATGVNIWGDNDLTAAKDGATENEALIVKLFNGESNSLSAIAVNSVSNVLNGEKALTLQYNQNAVTLAKGNIAAASAEDFNSDFSISPQPVRNEAVVTLNFNPSSIVIPANAGISSGISIELYDLKGTMVATYNFTSLSEGTNKLRLDVSNIPSGMYNAVIRNGAEVHNAKLIKVD